MSEGLRELLPFVESFLFYCFQFRISNLRDTSDLRGRIKWLLMLVQMSKCILGILMRVLTNFAAVVLEFALSA
jgi:hypothetical protein